MNEFEEAELAFSPFMSFGRTEKLMGMGVSRKNAESLFLLEKFFGGKLGFFATWSNFSGSLSLELRQGVEEPRRLVYVDDGFGQPIPAARFLRFDGKSDEKVASLVSLLGRESSHREILRGTHLTWEEMHPLAGLPVYASVKELEMKAMLRGLI